MVADYNSSSVTSTAYRIETVKRRYGKIPVKQNVFSVSPEKYEQLRAAKEEDAIGGARVLLKRPEEQDKTLLVSNRGESGWDIPGGSREPGETPEETARREVAEEVGYTVQLGDALQVFDWGFVPDGNEAAERVSGLWIHFEGVVTDDETDVVVQEKELLDGRWFTTLPDDINTAAKPIVQAFFTECD